MSVVNKRYDARCREWEGLMSIGPDPMQAAYARPGQWQLVYELRPLELIPYWLGIPFRPCHPVFAVIYDPDDFVFYTMPAEKVPELGRPKFVHGVRRPA